MSRRTRTLVALPALAGLAALLAWSFAGIPRFGDYRGPYGDVLNRVTVPERHVSNVVAATVFDVRGIDTMGEELILLAATVGITMLLRKSGREESERKRFEDRVHLEGISVFGVLGIGAVFLVGLWLVAFGYVTPGGGFQGGVVLAGAALLLYLAHGDRAFRAFGDEEILDPLEGLGAAAYVVLGLAALVSGWPFLHNLLGHGATGTLWSGGSVGLLNGAVALEVAAADVILVTEFLEQYIVPLGVDQR